MNIHTLHSLTVLCNLLKNPILSAYSAALNCKFSVSSLGRLYARILEQSAEDDLNAYFVRAILKDRNIIAEKSAAAEFISPKLMAAFKRDLDIISQSISGIKDAFDGHLNELQVDIISDKSKIDLLSNGAPSMILTFYKEKGFGDFAFYKAFKYADKQLTAIESTADITLDDLKEYAEEKAVIKNNIENFLNNRPYSNMLLYGEKGTGKSSTMHAMLNHFFKGGLRFVELTKSQIPSLSDLFLSLPEKPHKFIVFIDDLTLSDRDENFNILKATLEGSLFKKGSHIMVCCTTNRRHLIAESFSDRKDDVHLSDTLSEQLSLADRFGLAVLFDSPNKKLYLDIVLQLAKDSGINLSEKELVEKAELFALRKGGRSPRRAKQFIDSL